MKLRTVHVLLLALPFAAPIYAQDPDLSSKAERVFQQVVNDEPSQTQPDGALIIGSYVLDAKATEKLLQVETLAEAIKKIRLTKWRAEPWTKKNAELTVRQRMDDYIETAREFYAGEGERPGGVRGKRLEKYTDTELGDRQLASALVTVRMSTAWDVPLQSGQAERLDSVLRLRLSMVKDATKP